MLRYFYIISGICCVVVAGSPYTCSAQTITGNSSLKPTVPSLSTRVTSLTVDFPALTPTPSKTQVRELLTAPVTFTVKDASFLTAFDAALSAANKPCRIECRGVQSMKLSFGVRITEMGGVLDALAKAGGCKLYVLPSKLLICPPTLLNEGEKKNAMVFSSLLNENSLAPIGKLALTGAVNSLLDVSNTNISLSVENATLAKTLDALFDSTQKPHRTEYRMPLDRQLEGRIPTSFTFSFQDTPYGQIQDMIARMVGCEVYLLPDRYLISAPNMLTEEEKKVAVLATKQNTWEDPSVSHS